MLRNKVFLSLIALSSLWAVSFRLTWRDQEAPDFTAATTLVTDENFSDVVLTSEKSVLMEFYGDYCLVCRKLNSKLLTLANEYSETVNFARVNLQDSPELIQR